MVVDILLTGVVGGFVATVAMTAVMMVLGDGSPPPTAELVAKVAGGEPADHKMPGMILHLLYGVGAGAAFAVGYTFAALPADAVWQIGSATVYGFLLFVVGAVFWMKTVLDKEPGKDEVKLFLVVHLVYGAVLGGWLALGL